jgi:hypothetical protein
MAGSRVLVDKLGAAELNESITLQFHNLTIDQEFSANHAISEEFYLCGNSWRLLIYPIGVDDDSAYAAVRLKNSSNKRVIASYIIKLKSTRKVSDDVVFTDPEGVIRFDAHGGNDQWGTDEFAPCRWLIEESYGFLHEDCLTVEIEIEVYGVVELDAHPLTKAIERAAETKDLIALADRDLSLITKKVRRGFRSSVRRVTSPFFIYAIHICCKCTCPYYAVSSD